MRSKAVGFRMRFWPALLCLLASLDPAKVHAQPCTLDPPLPSSIDDSAAGTRFFPSGGDGQILVQRKYTDTTVIRVFETSGPDPASWKDPVERTVISFRPMPEKGYEEFKGFAIDKTSLIRLIVPNIKNSFWQTRTFVVRICDQAARGQAASGQGASGQAAAAQGAAAQGATSQAATGNALAIVQVPISPPIWAKLMTIGFLLCVYGLFD